MYDTPFDELIKQAYFAGVRDAHSLPDAPAEEIEVHYRAWRDNLGGRTWTQADWHRAYNGPDSELPGMWSTSDLVGGESDAEHVHIEDGTGAIIAERHINVKRGMGSAVVVNNRPVPNYAPPDMKMGC